MNSIFQDSARLTQAVSGSEPQISPASRPGLEYDPFTNQYYHVNRERARDLVIRTEMYENGFTLDHPVFRDPPPMDDSKLNPHALDWLPKHPGDRGKKPG